MSDRKTGIDQCITEFLEHLEVERGLSPLTIRNYSFWLRRFSDWMMKQYPVSSIQQIDTDTVRKFRVWLARKPGRTDASISLATQGYHIIALRALLRWCARNDIKTLVPEKVDVPKNRAKSFTFLTTDQMGRLLGAPTGMGVSIARDRALLEVLFSTGLRVSELVGLNRDQIDLVRREFGVIGKGGKARVVFLSTRAADRLREYLEKRDDHFVPVFIRYGGKKPDPVTADKAMRLTTRSVERIIEKYRKKIGLSVKITPHGIRHTFATDLLHGGADLREVQELLGHKNVSTTQIYTHVTNRQLREVHERAHSGNR